MAWTLRLGSTSSVATAKTGAVLEAAEAVGVEEKAVEVEMEEEAAHRMLL